MSISLIDVSTYLPGEPIGADYYAQFADSDDLRDNLMFRAPKFRHHVAEDETAIDMVERPPPVSSSVRDRTPSRTSTS
jgi:3-oxoacyl-[acyl-carrier-protein] synthase III